MKILCDFMGFYFILYFLFQEEIHCLSRAGMQLHYGEHMFERLEVDASVALKIFEENRYTHFILHNHR